MNAPAGAALACRNCGQALRELALQGHYGRALELDLCAPCHLLWFDALEGAHLTGPSLLKLVGEMAAAQRLPHTPLQPKLGCLRCAGPLRTVHNPTRFGASLQLECAQRHGAWQSFGQFLQQKGLVRPMSSADRHRALQRDGALHCVNCGGNIGQADTACPWCTSVPAVVDVARLALALDPEGATRQHAVHRQRGEAGAMACAACGAAQPAEGGWACTSCGATLTAPGLAEAYRQVSALGPALHAHAEKPAPQVVAERLARQQPALQRQRERARAMQAESDLASGRTPRRERDGWFDVELVGLAIDLLRWAGRLVSRLWH